MKTNKETAIAFVNGIYADSLNMHTDGNTIKSYWTTIASRAASNLILITDRYYSNTTAHHKSHICTAASRNRVTVVAVPIVQPISNEDHKVNTAYLRDEWVEMGKKVTRARTNGDYWRSRQFAALSDLNTYCNTFGLNAAELIK